jgi:hypothetical protein
MEGWTGTVNLLTGDVREARNRAKFPRWGKLSVFSKSLIGTLETSFITALEMLTYKYF